MEFGKESPKMWTLGNEVQICGYRKKLSTKMWIFEK